MAVLQLVDDSCFSVAIVGRNLVIVPRLPVGGLRKSYLHNLLGG